MQFRYWYISLSYSFFGTLRPSLTYNAMETSFSWVLEILNQVSLWRVAVTETEMRALKFVFCHFKFVSVNTNLIHPCFFSVGCHYFSVFYVSKLLFWGLCFEISVVPLKKKKLVVNIFSGWHSIKGRFISVIGANISCACAKSPEGLSPSAHLADGCLDLILVKHTSRLQYLRHMIRLSSKADQVRNQILLTVPRTF